MLLDQGRLMNKRGALCALVLALLFAVATCIPTLAWATDEHHQGDGWSPWEEATSLPTEAGKYYLTVDVTLDATWEVPAGEQEQEAKETELCLNGHNILLKKDQKGSVVKVPNNAKLVLEECEEEPGVLKGGTGTEGKGGAILVEEGGTFELDGPTIKKNEAKEFQKDEQDETTKVSLGGGIYVDGTVTLRNGKITENNAGVGAGVYVSSKGTLNVEGLIKVTGNKDSAKKQSNVVLSEGKTITVQGALKSKEAEGEDESTASMGVTVLSKENEPTSGVFTDAFNEKSEVDDPADVFSSDDKTYHVYLTTDESEARLAKKVTLAFNANEGYGTMSSISGAEDSIIDLPSNAFSRPGYTFKEWNTKADGDDTGTTYANEQTGVELAEMTLYAQWEKLPEPPVACVLSFDRNGGTGTMGSETAEKGSEVTVPACEFTYAGYTFTAWNTSKDGKGTGTAYKPGEKIKLDSNTTLYAQWQKMPVEYELTYKANGGTGTMDKETAQKDSKVTVPACEFTRDGYTFTEWNTKKDGTGTAYKPGKKITLDSKNVTLYAQWTQNVAPTPSDYLTVTFNKNAEDATGTMDPQTAKNGEAFALAANAFSRSGYTFLNWNTKADGSGTAVPNQAKVKLNSNVTLYAQWQQSDSLTVTFNKNADDATGTMQPQTAKKGEAFALAANAFSRSGYTFLNWNTKADGTGIKVPNQAKVKLNSSVTLYAQWVKNGSTPAVNGVSTEVNIQSGAPQVNPTNLAAVAQAMASAADRSQGVVFTLTAAPTQLGNLSAEEQNAVNEFIRRYGLTLGSTFDLALTKQVGSAASESLHSVSPAMEFTVPVPQEIQGGETGTRQFFLLRLHDGAVTALTGTTGTTLTAKTDKFSFYAIGYRNSNTQTPSPMNRTTDGTAAAANRAVRSATGTSTPNTGDSTTYVGLAVIAVLGAVAVVAGVLNKRRQKQ